MADIMNYLTLQAPILHSHLNGLHLPAHSMGAQVLSQAQASALQQQLANHQLASQQLANQHMGSLQQQVGHSAVRQLILGHDGQRACVIAVEAGSALPVASSAHTSPTAVSMMLLRTYPADIMTCKQLVHIVNRANMHLFKYQKACRQ